MHLIHHDFIDEAHHSEKDQHPHTFVLSCIDSRVPPEIVFDQGIGNLFVARVAGNIEDDNILGSMEYAVQVKGTKLLVVLGHSNCGAVQGAIDNVNLGHLTQLTNQIKVAFSHHRTYPLPEHLSNEAGRLNVLSTIDHILSSSQIIRELVNKKKIKIVGTFYDLHTGKVEFYNNEQYKINILSIRRHFNLDNHLSRTHHFWNGHFSLGLLRFGRRDLFHTSSLKLNKTIGTINTILLLTSGFFVAKGIHFFKASNIKKTVSYFNWAMVGGFGFLVLKSIEYYEKLEAGLHMDYNSFFRFYWLLTGFHFIHVIVGLVILIIITFSIRKKQTEASFEDIEASASFWHMCDLIWLLLFPILYLLF